MVNDAGMTADEAEAALSEMGIDAEIETSTQEAQDTEEAAGMIATVENVN